jgi:hypothetical protein
MFFSKEPNLLNTFYRKGVTKALGATIFLMYLLIKNRLGCGPCPKNFHQEVLRASNSPRHSKTPVFNNIYSGNSCMPTSAALAAFCCSEHKDREVPRQLPRPS